LEAQGYFLPDEESVDFSGDKFRRDFLIENDVENIQSVKIAAAAEKGFFDRRRVLPHRL